MRRQDKSKALGVPSFAAAAAALKTGNEVISREK
jgi:hypothetical protein